LGTSLSRQSLALVSTNKQKNEQEKVHQKHEINKLAQGKKKTHKKTLN